MLRIVAPLLVSAALLLPGAAGAQVRLRVQPDPAASIGGRAPWNQPWEYDSGSDNDKHPSRPYYQQGRGQQSGGPSRNLIPYDNGTLSPR